MNNSAFPSSRLNSAPHLPSRAPVSSELGLQASKNAIGDHLEKSSAAPHRTRSRQSFTSGPSAPIGRKQGTSSREAQSSATLGQLPDEVVLLIANQLAPEHAMALRKTSSYFLRLTNDTTLINKFLGISGLAPRCTFEQNNAKEPAWRELSRAADLRARYAQGPRRISLIRHPSTSISWLDSSSDGKYVLFGSIFDKIYIWDCDKGRPQFISLEGHTSWVFTAKFSADGQYIITGSHDRTVRLWDRDRGWQQTDVLRGHDSEICAVNFSPSGRYIITGDAHGLIRTFDREHNLRPVTVIDSRAIDIKSCGFSSDERLIIWRNGSFDISFWDLEEASPRKHSFRSIEGTYFLCAKLLKDNSILLLSSNGQVVRYDTKSQDHIEWQGSDSSEEYCAGDVSPDGRSIVAVSQDGIVKMWDRDEGASRARKLTEGAQTRYDSIAFSQSGEHLIIATNNGAGQLLDFSAPVSDTPQCPISFWQHPLAALKFYLKQLKHRLGASAEVPGRINRPSSFWRHPLDYLIALLLRLR